MRSPSVTRAPAARVGSNARYVLIGNILYAGGQWLQLVILAQLGGPSAVGAYAYALALTAPVMMAASLQTRMLQASDTRGEYTLREYLRLRAATTAAAMLVIAAVAALVGHGGSLTVLLAVCVMRSADALADIHYGEWQRHERMGVIGVALAANAAGSVALMLAASAAGLGVPGAAAGGALGSCGALLFVQRRTSSDLEMGAQLHRANPVRWRRVARLAVAATPLGVILLLTSLQQNVPRYFIEHARGLEALGLFAAASQLTSAGMMIVSAFTSAAVPRLATLCAAGDTRGFRSSAGKLVVAGSILGAAGVVLSWLLGRPALALIYRDEFAAGSRVLVVLSVAAGLGFLGSILGSALTAARVIVFQPFLFSATLVILATSCAVLVPRHGGEGAAWSMTIASGVQVLVSYVVLMRFRARGHPSPDASTAGASVPARQLEDSSA